jgi:hypothetical protein
MAHLRRACVALHQGLRARRVPWRVSRRRLLQRADRHGFADHAGGATRGKAQSGIASDASCQLKVAGGIATAPLCQRGRIHVVQRAQAKVGQHDGNGRHRASRQHDGRRGNHAGIFKVLVNPDGPQFFLAGSGSVTGMMGVECCCRQRRLAGAPCEPERGNHQGCTQKGMVQNLSPDGR